MDTVNGEQQVYTKFPFDICEIQFKVSSERLILEGFSWIVIIWLNSNKHLFMQIK